MTRIDRRTFLKIGTASAGILALEGGFRASGFADDLLGGGASVSRTTGRRRRAVASTCLGCPARCGILGFVEDGVLLKIEGNPEHPNNRGRLCARGQAGLNQVYNPDRLLQPLRRVGPRGEHRWKTVSWNEALDAVAAKLKTIRDAGQVNDLVLASGLNGREGFVGRFARAFGTTAVFDRTGVGQANAIVARELTWGAATAVYDAANAKYIMNFGANPFETHEFYNPLVQRIVDGRVNGARLITLDPRLSNTAGKSDEWLPLRPGTDAFVALAMANVIMQQGLHDRAFVDQWLTCPASKLASHLAQFTPSAAQKVSGIRAADIARLAVEFATTKPAVAISSGGLSKHRNGLQNERAIALLNAITGNVDVRGGYCLPRTYDLIDPDPSPAGSPMPPAWLRVADAPLASQGIGPRLTQLVAGGKLSVGCLLTYEHDLVYASPDSQGAAAVLRNEKLVPFIVAVDSYLTETAALADVVLPAATYLERWEAHSPPSFALVPLVAISQPVVKPLGESRPFADITRELATRMGGGLEKYYAFATAEDFVRASVAKVDGLPKMGGMDYLKEHGVWFDPVAQPVYRSYEKAGFNTPSGLFEIDSRRLAEQNVSSLPTYEPIPDHDTMGEDDLHLIVYQWNVHSGERTANSKWLAEIAHGNPLLINPVTAKARDIKDGDRVEVSSRLRSLVTHARLTEGIHTQVVAIGDSCGHWEYGRIAQAKQFKSHDADTTVLWWGHDGNGTHPNPIIAVSVDPVGGGQAWMDTVVKVKRL